MTEKDYAPQKKESKKMVVNTPKKMAEMKTTVDNKKAKDKVEHVVKEDDKLIENKISEQTGEANEKKEEKKLPIVKKPVVKKTEAIVNAKNVPVSTKHSMAICKFIKGKRINDCIEYLEQVIRGRKAMPMRGEIPHRKGKMMSGRFPKNASKEFIILLKSLGANANANNLEEPIIYHAVANIGARPFGRFGRTRKKRTHVTIKVKEKKK